MHILTSILIILTVVGVLFVFVGIFVSKYPKEGRYLNLKDYLSIEVLTNINGIKQLLNLLTKNKNGATYKMTQRILITTETDISVKAMYLLKILSVILIALTVSSIKYTNADVLKNTIIAKFSSGTNLFQENVAVDYKYNMALYHAILKRTGGEALKKIDTEEKVEVVKKVIPELTGTYEENIVTEKATAFVTTFENVERVKIIDWSFVLLVSIAFFLPEILLFLKKLLKTAAYKNEVIKLENIMELLGNIKGFKTVDILEEMEKAATAYKKHLAVCKKYFSKDRKIALDTLRVSVKNKRFTELVDILRIYTFVDKKIAMETLERNKGEKEQSMLMLADENVNMVDMLAFISITPIVYELVNLLLKPMLDLIFEAFKYV